MTAPVDPDFTVVAVYPAPPAPSTTTTVDTTPMTSTSLIPPATVERATGGLPVTGVDVGSLILLGALAITAGAGIVANLRKRRP